MTNKKANPGHRTPGLTLRKYNQDFRQAVFPAFGIKTTFAVYVGKDQNLIYRIVIYTFAFGKNAVTFYFVVRSSLFHTRCMNA